MIFKLKAGMMSLTTPYLCDICGLEKFSNATGILKLLRYKSKLHEQVSFT